MGYWKSRGLRGSVLETMINTTNAMYIKHKLAVIQKVPTPITPTKIDNSRRLITEAYFDGKSTVDYIGAVQGIPICFDAKETSHKYLPLQNVHTHQIEFMQSFVEQKGVAFLIVEFKLYNEIFLLPFETLNEFYLNSKHGGRKSIPYEAFKDEYKITTKGVYLLHYLETLNQYLNNINY